MNTSDWVMCVITMIAIFILGTWAGSMLIDTEESCPTVKVEAPIECESVPVCPDVIPDPIDMCIRVAKALVPAGEGDRLRADLFNGCLNRYTKAYDEYDHRDCKRELRYEQGELEECTNLVEAHKLEIENLKKDKRALCVSAARGLESVKLGCEALGLATRNEGRDD